MEGVDSSLSGTQGTRYLELVNSDWGLHGEHFLVHFPENNSSPFGTEDYNLGWRGSFVDTYGFLEGSTLFCTMYEPFLFLLVLYKRDREGLS